MAEGSVFVCNVWLWVPALGFLAKGHKHHQQAAGT